MCFLSRIWVHVWDVSKLHAGLADEEGKRSGSQLTGKAWSGGPKSGLFSGITGQETSVYVCILMYGFMSVRCTSMLGVWLARCKEQDQHIYIVHVIWAYVHTWGARSSTVLLCASLCWCLAVCMHWEYTLSLSTAVTKEQGTTATWI